MSRRRPKARVARPAVAPAPPAPAQWWRAAILVLAGALAYGNSLSGPFVFDDRGTILDNTTIERVLHPGVLAAPHETPTAGRPAVNVTFAINYAVGGRDVIGYHVVNIALHLACGLLLFAIATRPLGSVNAAFAVALLWTLHPLTTEAVSYITQRTETLMSLFYLSTLYAAIRAHENAASRGRWEVCAIVACALGMASKESMVSAPLIVALYDRVFLFDSVAAAWRSRRRLYAGLAAGWVVLAALVSTAPRDLSAGFAAHDADAWTYLLNQTVMLTRYLWLSVWPRDLTLYYGWPVPLTPGDVWPHALLVCALLGATLAALWRWPRLGFLGAWFFVMLAPTSSVVPIATEVGAERRMYLALVAVVVLAVLSWRRLVGVAPARARWIHAVALVVVASLLAAGTRERNREYASSLRLAETTFARWPTPASHSMLGTELANAGRLREAAAHLREAAPAYPPARYYLATVLAASGDQAGAIEQFRGFIASQPPQLDQVFFARALLGDALLKAGRPEEAAAEYRDLLIARPGDPEIMTRLAAILLRQQEYAETIAIYREVLALRPRDRQALGGLGIALASTGRLDDAIVVFERAVAVNPSDRQARQNLDRALQMRGPK